MNSTYLKDSFFFDYHSAEIQDLISDFRDIPSEKTKIEKLYLKVRDGWRYNAYTIGLTDDHYKASTIIAKTEAHCIDKAILYISGLRALNIPARLRLAKVSNHIAAERLEEKLDAVRYSTPPPCLLSLRKYFDRLPEIVRRAYYCLGNYIVAQKITKECQTRPVIMDR